MRRKRIVIYGGTDLPARAERLVRHLVQALLTYPDTVIVTGGIIGVRGEPERITTDRAARLAAEARLGRAPDRLESWLPDPDEDDRDDLVRDWDAATRIFKGSTAEGRRFSLVLETDAIVTFKGAVHTATVLELALRANKPALPIPFTGGDSERYWAKHRSAFQDRFRNAEQLFDDLEASSLDALDESAIEDLATRIAAAIVAALDRWCLVLMPFGEGGGEAFFTNVLRPGIEARFGFIADRLDRSTHAGHIPQAFIQHVARADAVIADITGANPNVMYEIGHVHGRNAAPFLFWRREPRQPPPELPFYFKPETFRLVDPADHEDCAGFGTAVGEYLAEVLRSGMPHWLSQESSTRIT